ncbi:MAG: hypothetical protein V4650_14945 [Pseudomonadota bacterium]
MNHHHLTAPIAAFCLLTLAACASTSPQQQAAASTTCSKSKSAANGADCSNGSLMEPPVVDISKPAPAPGMATSGADAASTR